jgi:hypothetical protein
MAIQDAGSISKEVFKAKAPYLIPTAEDETDASYGRAEPPFGDVAEPSMGNCWYLNCRLAILLAARSLSSIFRAFKQAIGRREMQYAFNF